MRSKILPTIALFVLALAASQPLHAAVKDEWLQVRTKNFNLIGNASEKEIRRVGAKLEQFRETFRLLFAGSKLDAPIPTNVVVFRSDSSYRPFKPKRGDGKIDNFIAGYFQPGDDVNYITLAAGGTDADTFGTIFHEYVHFIVDTNLGKSNIPAWFNEGLAEYYQTFEMEGDLKAKLGMPQGGHLSLLRENKLLPLDSFFNTSNAGLHGHGSHSRSIFYAQAWAVVHYLVANNKTAGIDSFLKLSMRGSVDEKAFQQAFQMTYAELEKELRKYVTRATYTVSVATFKEKLAVASEMTVTPLSDAESNAYLGDLLYHTRRHDDAEPYLTAALAADPNQSMANTSMGMVKVRQRKYDEAKAYLDKAIAGDPRNHIAYYQLAYLLSRESRDDFGYVSAFPAGKAERMRELLKRAIEINPTFTESYELLAFVSIVTNDKFDEGIAAMVKALQYRPGNQRYTLRIAELYLRQEKFKEAADLINRVAKTADDEQVKSQAEDLLRQLDARNALMAQNAEARKRYEAAIAAGAKDGGVRPYLIQRGADGKEPTPEDVKRQAQDFEIRAINRELRKPLDAEVRLMGRIEKINCKGAAIWYDISSDSGILTLTSKDFQGLHLSAYVAQAADAEIACEAKPSSMKAVLTYRPAAANAKPTGKGELIAIEFVPDHFRILDTAESAERVSDTGPITVGPATNTVDADRSPAAPPERVDRRDFIFDQIRGSLRKPAAGEKRILGLIEKSECTSKGVFFFVKAGTQFFKLSGSANAQPEIKGFTQDIENVQIGCGMKALDVPVVVTYRETVDKKSKSNGELVSLEFVPKDFALEQ